VFSADFSADYRASGQHPHDGHHEPTLISSLSFDFRLKSKITARNRLCHFERGKSTAAGCDTGTVSHVGDEISPPASCSRMRVDE